MRKTLPLYARKILRVLCFFLLLLFFCLKCFWSLHHATTPIIHRTLPLMLKTLQGVFFFFLIYVYTKRKKEKSKRCFLLELLLACEKSDVRFPARGSHPDARLRPT